MKCLRKNMEEMDNRIWKGFGKGLTIAFLKEYNNVTMLFEMGRLCLPMIFLA